MALLVCVVAAAPASRLGLMVGLERAGVAVEDPPSVLGWVGSRERAVILVLDGEDPHGTLLDLRTIGHRSFVLALLQVSDARSYIDALRCGADAALPLNVPFADVLGALHAASRDLSAVPTAVLHSLVAGHRPDPPPGILRPSDVQLLTLLADGSGVPLIAQRLHMSERTAYRRRHQLFQRLGVASPAGAVAWAVRHGLI